MNRKNLFLVLSLLMSGFVTMPFHTVALPVSDSAVMMSSDIRRQIIVYKSNFDSLKKVPTQPFPGALGQDGWFSELAVSPAFGEIQDDVALRRRALHEFTSSSVPGLAQTIDKRLITPPNLARFPIIILHVNFYAHTSDLNAKNIFDAVLTITGGPFPGFEMLAFTVESGNGTPKGEAGLKVLLSRFNGVDNNEQIPLNVGQSLAWDTWHSITLVVNQAKDRYVSLTVDRQTEDLSAYALPRSEVESGVWVRGQLMEEIQAVILPNNEFGDATDDDIYWDNLRIIVRRSRCDREQGIGLVSNSGQKSAPLCNEQEHGDDDD